MSGGKNRLLDVLRALPAALVLLTGAAVIAAERDEELAHRLEAGCACPCRGPARSARRCLPRHGARRASGKCG